MNKIKEITSGKAKSLFTTDNENHLIMNFRDDTRPTERNRTSGSEDFFQAEDGIRDVERSRGLGDVYKRQKTFTDTKYGCLLYTSDAADDMQCVDLGGRRIIKKFRVLWVYMG